jgi:sec-independent protein translocase protein TatA
MFGAKLPEIILILLVVLLVFGGRGKLSGMMGDMAKGIKSFKKGLSEDDEDERPEARPVDPRVIDQRVVKSTERDTTKTG